MLKAGTLWGDNNRCEWLRRAALSYHYGVEQSTKGDDQILKHTGTKYVHTHRENKTIYVRSNHSSNFGRETYQV